MENKLVRVDYHGSKEVSKGTCHAILKSDGQGKTKEECLKSLSEAINLILEDRRQDTMREIHKMQSLKL